MKTINNTKIEGDESATNQQSIIKAIRGNMQIILMNLAGVRFKYTAIWKYLENFNFIGLNQTEQTKQDGTK